MICLCNYKTLIVLRRRAPRDLGENQQDVRDFESENSWLLRALYKQYED